MRSIQKESDFKLDYFHRTTDRCAWPKPRLPLKHGATLYHGGRRMHRAFNLPDRTATDGAGAVGQNGLSATTEPVGSFLPMRSAGRLSIVYGAPAPEPYAASRQLYR